MKSLQSFCFAIKQARIDQGLTQKALAEKAGVSRAWLIDFEQGRARRVEFGKVLDTIRALGLELDLSSEKRLKNDEELIMKKLFDV
jgi:transcriptional regulator with XRE-family HTH domain